MASIIQFLKELDLNLFLKLNSLHHPGLDSIMSFLSGQLIWIPMIVFFIFRAKKIFTSRMTLYFLLFLILTLIATDVTSSYFIKNIVKRMRPCRLEEVKSLIYFFGQKCGGKFGFVSSHAGNSFALIFFSMRTLKLKGIYQLFWALPLLVSYSRIYLGVHYPGDIVGGILVGLFWSAVMSTLYLSIKPRVQV